MVSGDPSRVLGPILSRTASTFQAFIQLLFCAFAECAETASPSAQVGSANRRQNEAWKLHHREVGPSWRVAVRNIAAKRAQALAAHLQFTQSVPGTATGGCAFTSSPRYPSTQVGWLGRDSAPTAGSKSNDSMRFSSEDCEAIKNDQFGVGRQGYSTGILCCDAKHGD